MNKAQARKKPSDYASNELDEGIAHVVRTLQKEGIHTYESCEGRPPIDLRHGRNHAFPDPTVRFKGTYADGYKALYIALEHGFPVSELRRRWGVMDNELIGPTWELVLARPVDD